MTEYLQRGDPKTCFGCGGCAHICPQSAITMVPNEEGFLYPSINPAACIHCGRCKAVCPYTCAAGQPKTPPLQAYAAQNRKPQALGSSSSGGVFAAAAQAMLDAGGAVCGCLLDNHLQAVHVLTQAPETVAQMQGSKYVQSDLREVYPQIRQRLDRGQPVLFVGTPCQVAGLKAFLPTEPEHLITLDLVCHGVPSPWLLSQYLAQIANTKGPVLHLAFRDKPRWGWRSQGTITYARGAKIKYRSISPFNSSYYQLYYHRNCVSRMSCYSCPYACTTRVGDLTLGDYWNAREAELEMDWQKGVSLVLANTAKGEAFLSKLAIKRVPVLLAHAVAGNGNLSHPAPMPESRKTIYAQMQAEGYAPVAKRCCRYQYIRPFLRRHMPQGLKRMLLQWTKQYKKTPQKGNTT